MPHEFRIGENSNGNERSNQQIAPYYDLITAHYRIFMLFKDPGIVKAGVGTFDIHDVASDFSKLVGDHMLKPYNNIVVCEIEAGLGSPTAACELFSPVKRCF